MTGADLKQLGIELFGEWGWQVGLARGLGRNVSTIRLYIKRDEIPAHAAQAAKGLRYEIGPLVRRLRAKGWAVYPIERVSKPRRRRGVVSPAGRTRPARHPQRKEVHDASG